MHGLKFWAVYLVVFRITYVLVLMLYDWIGSMEWIGDLLEWLWALIKFLLFGWQKRKPSMSKATAPIHNKEAFETTNKGGLWTK